MDDPRATRLDDSMATTGDGGTRRLAAVVAVGLVGGIAFAGGHVGDIGKFLASGVDEVAAPSDPVPRPSGNVGGAAR